MRGHFRDADHRVGAGFLEQGDRLHDVPRAPQRRGRLQNHHGVWYAAFVCAQPLDRVLQDRQMRRLVAREIGRPHERDVAAARSSRRRNRLVVSRENQAIEGARLDRGVNGVSDERFAGEQPEVLAWKPFRAATGGDDAEYAHVVSAFRRTSPPSGRACLSQLRASRSCR